jgi:hypothetical protein
MRSRSSQHSKPAIGWREWVSLPELGISSIKAKVDTGARSSSLHAYDVQTYERDGRSRVRFKVHPIQRNTATTIEADLELLDTRLVRNPGGGGREEHRPVILTDIEIGGERWPIELTLTRRDAMGFRMLLGRQAVRGRFLVDPGRSFLGGRRGEERSRR